MSKIFISHSSKDDDTIRYFTHWLVDQGYDYWIDNDPQRGIRAGERWIEALRRATNICECVVFLVSKSWLASEWCHKEVEKAQNYGRLCIGVILDDTDPQDEALSTYSDWQFCKIGAANALGGKDDKEIKLDDGSRHYFLEEGLTRLNIALEEADLSPTKLQWQFQSEDELPYRGLDPLTEYDGAIFFGRDADIHKRIHEIRELRERQKNQLIFINAPSGAGKSSFLRAGLIPRLKRDQRHFFVLPTIRKKTGLMDLENKESLLSIIDRAYKDFEASPGISEIKQTLNTGQEGLLKLIADLKKKYQDKHLKPFSINTSPTMILPIDQGEELLSDDADVEQLFSQLNTLIQHENKHLQIIIVFTLRSDTWEKMRNKELVKQNQSLQTLFDLSPISNTNYRDIITKPLEVWQKAMPEITKPQTFSDELIEQLIKDNTGNDALPVLSFTLRDLVNHYKDKKEIHIDHYKQQGGSQGIIENIINNALKQAGFDMESNAFKTLLSHLFIPHLIKLDAIDSHASRDFALREKLYEINADKENDIDTLINVLVESRILSDDGQNIEIAHESIFRKWPFMVDQIENQRHNLSNFARIERHSRDFAKEKDLKLKPDKLVDQGTLLSLADQLLQQPAFLSKAKEPLIREYIQACHDKEDKAEREEKRKNAILKKHLNQAVYNEARALAALAESLINPIDYKLASKMLLAAWPRNNDDKIRPQGMKVLESANNIIQLKNKLIGVPMEHKDTVEGAQWNRTETQILSWSADGSVRVWDANTHTPIGDPMKHEDSVNGAQWNRTETQILSWSEDGSVRVWDANTHTPIGDPMKHEDEVWGAQWNQTETQILSWSEDGSIRIWDAHAHTFIGVSMEHEGAVWDAQWNQKETKILSWSKDGSVRVWDANTHTPIGDPMKHEDEVWGAQWNQDETKILSWSEDGSIRIWDAHAHTFIGVSMEHEGAVWDAQWNQKETKILSWSKDGSVRVWDANTYTPIGEPMDHEDSVNGAQWNQDETKILSWSADNSVRVWSTRTRTLIDIYMVDDALDTKLQWNQDETKILSWSDDNSARANAYYILTLMEHDNEVEVLGAQWNQDETQILSWSADGSVQVWSTRTHTLIDIYMVDGALDTKLQLNQDETKILSWSDDNSARANAYYTLTLMEHDNEVEVLGAQWNQDGTHILSWSDDNTVRLWDATTQTRVGEPMKHESRLNGAKWNQDGTHILSWSDDGFVQLWDATAQTRVGEPMKHESRIRVLGARWNQNETHILSWSVDNTVRHWDATTQTRVGEPMKHESVVVGAQWNQNETHILSWSEDGTVRIWDANTQTLIDEPMKYGNEVEVLGAQWNQDKTQILSWSRFGFVRVWDANTQTLIGESMLHENEVLGARWNQDETQILSWSADGSVRVWDARTHTLIGEPMKHEDEVWGAQWNQDETKILSWSEDGSVRVWDAQYYGKRWSLQELCDRLKGDYDLDEIRIRFGITVSEDICQLPVPYDHRKLEKKQQLSR